MSQFVSSENSHIGLKKILDSRTAMISILAWVVFAIPLTIVYGRQFEELYNIDIPSHIAFGMSATAIVAVLFQNRKSMTWIVSLIFLSFVVWEGVELSLVYSFPGVEWVQNLFLESVSNRVQDLIMDTVGFPFAVVLSWFVKEPLMASQSSRRKISGRLPE